MVGYGSVSYYFSYIIVAGIWILLSDKVLTFLVSDSALMAFFLDGQGMVLCRCNGSDAASAH